MIFLENNLKGKTVYLRADLNLPTINGKVTDTTRIKSILPTIRELKKKINARLLSYLTLEDLKVHIIKNESQTYNS